MYPKMFIFFRMPKNKSTWPKFSRMCRSIFLFTFLAILCYITDCQENDRTNPASQLQGFSPETVEGRCQDCLLTSKSIDELARMPRHMTPYGQVEERINLDKIKKLVCREYMDDYERERCRNFYFSNTDSIRDWKDSKPLSSFHDYVCIQKLKYCCPRNSFGAKCRKCPKCNVNQKCSGEGIRTGNGTCICKPGHTGPDCSSCSKGFYSNENVIEKVDQDHPWKQSCKPCHKSCLYCSRDGPLGCEVCNSGYSWVPQYGCSDVDECLVNRKICGDNTFCVNTEGSYFCYECDRGCDGCRGDGPDMCLRCAKGYNEEKGLCVAPKATILSPYASYHRYAIYVGLSVSTYILLQNDVYLSGMVGLAVGLYIGVSEYVMSTSLTH